VVPQVFWKFDGSSNEEELNRRLSFMMLRRMRSDVSMQLPAFTREVIEVEVPRPKFSTAALTSNAALRRELDRAADQKFPQVIEKGSEYVAAGHKLVVFTHRKAIAHQMAEALKSRFDGARVEVVTGEVSQDKRRAIVESKPDVLCCTMDSMGVGISLAYADDALFAELHYVPAVLYQAERRLPRHGSTSPKRIIYVCARGTADDLVRRVILGKMKTDAKVVGKNDSRLLEDLDAAQESAADKLRKIYERMLKEDE
jgi:SWI/SNF-related matrix-associated actin-dependent regulator of chromatin subfamily A-like protein 1